MQFNSVNRGRCGLCGDEYSGLQHHMAGGTFASGIIARSYSRGQVIDIEIDLVANHLVSPATDLGMSHDPPAGFLHVRHLSPQ